MGVLIRLWCLVISNSRWALRVRPYGKTQTLCLGNMYSRNWKMCQGETELLDISIKWGFSDGSVVKGSACNARDAGLIPRPGRSAEGGNGNPPQYSCLKNPMDRGA